MSTLAFIQAVFIVVYMAGGTIVMILDSEDMLPEMPTWVIILSVIAGTIAVGSCINLGINGFY